MADVVCPECGQVSTLPSIRRASDEFCSHCDFPLFWAPTAVPAETVSASNDSTLRRLPGAGGRLLIGTRVCPTCGELNSIAEKFCTRCHNDMDPQPLPVAAPPPPPPPVPEVLPPKQRWWPWIAFAAVTILTLLIVIVITN